MMIRPLYGSFGTSCRLVVFALALTTFAPVAVRGQARPQQPSRALAVRDSLRLANREPVATPEPEPIRKESIITNGSPRSFVVVSVPVPDEIPLGTPLSYEVNSAGSVAIIGRRGGTIEGTDTRRVVLVTMGIPAHARAGRIVGARVVFSVPGSSSYEVPVEIDVLAVRRITMSTATELRGVVTGDRLDVRYRLLNAGNIRDSVTVRMTPPAGWNARSLHGDGSLALEPGVEREGVLRLFVPATSGTGDFFLKLDASSAGEERASALVRIEVTGRTAGGALGPTLHTGLAVVGGGGAEAASVLSLGVNGAMSSTVQIDGRVALATSNDALATRGFARVNSFVTTPYMSVWSPDWRVSAGNTSASFSELTGVNAWGSGLSGHYTFGTSSVGAVAARPPESVAGQQGRGQLFGLTYERQQGRLSLSSSLTRLADGQLHSRELTAVGFGAGIADLPIGTLSGEVAYRDFAKGSGLGWSADLHKGEAQNRAQIRVMHAPGGSDAFARARNEVSGTFSRALTRRWDVGATFFATRDSNQAFPLLESRSASLRQQFRLTPATAMSLEARASSFDAQSASLNDPSFGNGERRLSGGVSSRRGAWSYSGELGIEAVTRRADITEEFSSSLSGLRSVWRGTADWSTTRGVLQIENSYEHSAAGSGSLPRQLTVGARASQVRVSLLPRDVFLDGEILYQSWGVARSAATIYRVGASAPLPNGFALSMQAEHNPLFGSASATPWVVSMKIERGSSLPRLRLSSSSGVVFQDLNANSIRDPEEPGVGNVAVRQGDARAVTTREGRYEFWDKTRGMPTVDISTLPYGWVLGELPKTINAVHRDIALVPTSNIELELVLSADPAGRIPEVDLSQVAVFARDSRGRDWQARRSSSDMAVFDALPLGHYDIEFDFSALTEPLRVREKQSFDVTGRTSVSMTVPLFGRPLRFFRPQTAAPTTPDNAVPPAAAPTAAPAPSVRQ
jgi:hypothetical protein